MAPESGRTEAVEGPSERPVRARRWEPWLAFILAAVAYVALAWRVVHVAGWVDWEVVSSTARAYDAALAGRTLNLSLMGFAQPPLPAILQIPVIYLVPQWATEAFAGPLVSALIGALAMALACRLLRETGVHALVAWLLLLLLAANPAWLAACITGSPLALVGLFGAATALCLLRWSRQRSLRDLILCGLVVAAAPMAAFEAVSLPLAAAAVVLVVLWRSPRQPHELGGTLIALLLPAVYMLGGWALLCWVLVGDPLCSLRDVADARLFAATVGVQFLAFAALLATAWLAGSNVVPLVLAPRAEGISRLFAAVCFLALVPLAVALAIPLHPGQPHPTQSYTILQRGDLPVVRAVAEHAAVAAGAKRVLVDSDLDFAIRLLSGQPKTFVTVREAQRELATGADLLEVVSYVLANRENTDRLKPLLGRHEVHRLWRQQGWRMYEITR